MGTGNRRKKEWIKNRNLNQDDGFVQSLDQNVTTLQCLRASNKCPNKFRLQARIVDFYPLNLVDSLVLQCSHCKIE